MWLGVWQLLTSKHLSGLEQPKSAHNLKKQHCSPFPMPDHSYQLHFHIPITKAIANKATEYYCKKTCNIYQRAEQEVILLDHI